MIQDRIAPIMATAYNIAELRRRARRKLPRMIFDFVDGGSEEEVTLRRNVEAFSEIALVPRVLRPTVNLDLAVEIFGDHLSSPLIVAPAGLSGRLWPHGELAVARACARAGIAMTLSHASTCTLEECAAEGDGPKWFNVVIYKDRGLVRALVERAQAAGYRSLCVTVDQPVLGQRERDIRNGYTVPARHHLRRVLDLISHPGWLWRMRRTLKVTMKNYTGDGAGDLGSVATRMLTEADVSLSWRDLEWLRSIWTGPLTVKGILDPRDARQAVELGADGIVVSNHGGRQLDGAPASVEMLPAVADAVGDQAEVLFDGGIRRGADVLKAIALGARACLIGRAHLWGLAYGGEAGVFRSIQILSTELERAMTLGGWASFAEVDRSAVLDKGNPGAG